MTKQEKMFFAVKILAIIGISLAWYLLWERFFQPSFQLCNINSTVNCTAIISGAVSNTFGIPTPLIGMTGYLIILIAAFLKKSRLMLGMATFGLLFCLWISSQEIFVLHTLCPVCILCQLDMLSVFVLSLLITRTK